MVSVGTKSISTFLGLGLQASERGSSAVMKTVSDTSTRNATLDAMRYVALLSFPMFLASPAFAGSPVPVDGVISEPGDYYLTADRTSVGPHNIKIEADNVDLNLNGFTVRCDPPNPATAADTYGIFASARNYLTIRNGAVTGCFMGVNVRTDTHNLTIRGVDFSGNTAMGVNAGGRNTEISDSIFADIGGYATEAYAVGINNPGPNCKILRNAFRNIHRQSGAPSHLLGEGVAVLFGANNTGCEARHNWLENDEPDEGLSIGIWVGEAPNVTISENSVTNFAQGVAASAKSILMVTNNRLLDENTEGSVIRHRCRLRLGQ